MPAGALLNATTADSSRDPRVFNALTVFVGDSPTGILSAALTTAVTALIASMKERLRSICVTSWLMKVLEPPPRGSADAAAANPDNSESNAGVREVTLRLSLALMTPGSSMDTFTAFCKA